VKIKEILKEGRPTTSFEFFPPKDEKGYNDLVAAIAQLKELNPTFVSVTYGAGGSTRDRTIDVVRRVKSEFGIESMAHLTCVGATREHTDKVLDDLDKHGIDNVLALRGDVPRGPENAAKDWFTEFKHAIDLVQHIRKKFGDRFSVGVAGYPEKHPEAPSYEEDLLRLKEKVDAGADFVITQLFFLNEDFFKFARDARAIGITVPIMAGIMPITNYAQIQKFTTMCGAKIPRVVAENLEPVKENLEAVRHYGVEFATAQCAELLQNGVDGLHFYTLNRSHATVAIVENLEKLGLRKR
jgi:methylenetetrahydrofolate reductase (NADPH)